MSYATYTYIKKYPVVIAQKHMHSWNWNARWNSALLKHTHTHTNRLIVKLMNDAFLLRGHNTVTIFHFQPHTHQSIFPSFLLLFNFFFTQHPLANFHFVTSRFLFSSFILILSSCSVLVTLLLSFRALLLFRYYIVKVLIYSALPYFSCMFSCSYSVAIITTCNLL